jgi:hypothetical protein
MKTSFWKRLRLWWHMKLRGLSKEAAGDLGDGIDLGDADIEPPPLQFRNPAPRPPAHPGLPTLTDIDRIDRAGREAGHVDPETETRAGRTSRREDRGEARCHPGSGPPSQRSVSWKK